MLNGRRAVALALALAVGVFLATRRYSSIPDADPHTVVSQVRQLNQLATVRYTVQKIVGIKEEKDPVGSESILLVMQARVEAGIDLTNLREQDVFHRPDGALVVRLPEAKILNIAVDEKQTKVWDRTKTWWTPWVPYSNDLEKKARMLGLNGARQSAIDMGILKQAEAGASEAIRSLLALTGTHKVEIVPASAS